MKLDLLLGGGATAEEAHDNTRGKGDGGYVFHRNRWSHYLLIAAAACGVPDRDGAVVRPGIDVLISDSLHLLDGARVGLVTNQAGVGRNGSSNVELLLNAGVNLTTLFSPEHGVRGLLDQENIGHGVDSTYGLPIYSLYGETRTPTPDMLKAVDVLVIDLQDIGTRTYSYTSTTLVAMKAARAANIRTIVLDRPNPIGGRSVQGPIMTPHDTSFAGMLQIPLRHGMTIGELARYGDNELDLGTGVTVIPVDGWQRDMWFDAVGLPWIAPSPNMPNLESATHYAGTVMFEATNLSVGRGTPIAFQVLGAPWLRPAEVVSQLGDLSGVAVSDTIVTPDNPTDGKYPGLALPSIRLRVIDRTMYNPVQVATRILATIYLVHGEGLQIREGRLDRLAGTDAVRRAVSGGDLAELWRVWDEELDGFRARREVFLLYK